MKISLVCTQRSVAQAARVPLPSFSKLNNLFCDRVTGRADDVLGVLEGHKGHFESDANETSGLGIKSVTFQVGPDRHGGGMLIPFTQM
jgi:hypothetical protein